MDPEGDPPSGVTFETRLFDQLSTSELYEILKLRADVFVVEQASPYPDLDGRDDGADHLVARMGERVVGYARWYEEEDHTVLGRIVTARTHRGRGLGRRLVETALGAIGPRDVLISAQAALEGYYRTLGFESFGPRWDDHGVEHVRMLRPRPPRSE